MHQEVREKSEQYHIRAIKAMYIDLTEQSGILSEEKIILKWNCKYILEHFSFFNFVSITGTLHNY